MEKHRSRPGFTLIEILLVVVIIGVMLVVIVPRAWRANVDAKYNLVRQAGNELAAYGQQWAEQQLQSQQSGSVGMLNWYLASLCGWTSGTYNVLQWVPSSSVNWSGANVSVRGRNASNWNPGSASLPSNGVGDIVPPEKMPRNPFNGATYFMSTNNPAVELHAIPGAMASGVVSENTGNQWESYNYYALVFQGTDNDGYSLTASGSFHAGQGPGMEGLRNGIFMARTR